jgi:hypothetical protein
MEEMIRRYQKVIDELLDPQIANVAISEVQDALGTWRLGVVCQNWRKRLDDGCCGVITERREELLEAIFAMARIVDLRNQLALQRFDRVSAVTSAGAIATPCFGR